MHKVTVLAIGAVIIIVGAILLVVLEPSEKSAVMNTESIEPEVQIPNDGTPSIEQENTTQPESSQILEEKAPENAPLEDMSNEAESLAEDRTTDPAHAQGTYQAYSAEKLALANEGDVLLFFHATWCPSCKALDADINNNLSAIPDSVHILKLDYDSEKELKKKYNVTRQHTLIQIDANGNELKRLPYWLLTLESIIASLSS